MANPKVKMKAELEEKYRLKYEEKLKEAEKNFLAQLAVMQADFGRMVEMAMQHSADAALMAADDTFDVNAYSAEKFHTAHVKYANKMAELTIEDAKTDPDIVYTKEDIDRRLLQIVGADNFVPWDERYAGRKENKA